MFSAKVMMLVPRVLLKRPWLWQLQILIILSLRFYISIIQVPTVPIRFVQQCDEQQIQVFLSPPQSDIRTLTGTTKKWSAVSL